MILPTVNNKIKHREPLYLVLQNIRSLLNIGAIFRTADAFSVNKIYLCGYSAYPPERQMDKISKTALGAEKSVPWEYHKQTTRLIKKLKSQKVSIVALEITKKSIPLSKFTPCFPLAIILGNEVRGVSKNILQLCDTIVEIPQTGIKESLNVATASAIALYEICTKRK